VLRTRLGSFISAEGDVLYIIVSNLSAKINRVIARPENDLERAYSLMKNRRGVVYILLFRVTNYYYFFEIYRRHRRGK